MANTIFYAFVLLAATVTVCTAGFLGSEQVLTATGTVKCGPKPSSGKETWVALEDDGKFPGFGLFYVILEYCPI